METDFELIETEIALKLTVFRPKEKDSALKKYRRRRTLMQSGRRAELGKLELSLREIEGVGWGTDSQMDISLGNIKRKVSKKEEIFCDPEIWNEMPIQYKVEPRSSQAHSTF